MLLLVVMMNPSKVYLTFTTRFDISHSMKCVAKSPAMASQAPEIGR